MFWTASTKLSCSTILKHLFDPATEWAGYRYLGSWYVTHPTHHPTTPPRTLRVVVVQAGSLKQFLLFLLFCWSAGSLLTVSCWSSLILASHLFSIARINLFPIKQLLDQPHCCTNSSGANQSTSCGSRLSSHRQAVRTTFPHIYYYSNFCTLVSARLYKFAVAGLKYRQHFSW